MLVVFFAFVMTLFFKAFPNDDPGRHIPFSKVEMHTKTWVYLGTIHVSFALLLFALRLAITDDQELRRLILRLIVMEFATLIDYLLTYNADFWLPEFDTNVIKLVIYGILMGWIIVTDIIQFFYAKNK